MRYGQQTRSTAASRQWEGCPRKSMENRVVIVFLIYFILNLDFKECFPSRPCEKQPKTNTLDASLLRKLIPVISWVSSGGWRNNVGGEICTPFRPHCCHLLTVCALEAFVYSPCSALWIYFCDLLCCPVNSFSYRFENLQTEFNRNWVVCSKLKIQGCATGVENKDR